MQSCQWHPCKKVFIGNWLIDEKHSWQHCQNGTNRKHYQIAYTPNGYKCWNSLSSIAIIIRLLNTKSNKEMNGIMDPLQMMVKSSFYLQKHTSQWICICMLGTILFKGKNGAYGWSLSSQVLILHNCSKSTRRHYLHLFLKTNVHSIDFITDKFIHYYHK